MSAVIRIQLREGESEGVGLNFSMKGFMRLRRRSVKALPGPFKKRGLYATIQNALVQSNKHD
jgi:hypothetical protein